MLKRSRRSAINALSHATILPRWLLLRGLAAVLRLVLRDPRRAEFVTIAVGNHLFRSSLSEQTFDSFEAHLQSLPPELAPYARIADLDTDLRRGLVVDVGSGLGQYTDALTQRGATRVVGVELQPAKAAFARRRHRRAGVQFACGRAETLPLASGCAGLVFSHTVFEHLPDIDGALHELHRVLAPDGCALLSVNFIHNEGGHHLAPFVHFPWATWVVSEESLCAHWSLRLARIQAQGRGRYYPPHTEIRTLADGSEIHLNRIDFESFEAAVTAVGLRIAARFCSEPVARVLPFVTRIPGLGRFLTGTIFYRLEKA